jgi:uncharacterized membrane protein YoaK (UPF0700 family)
MVHDSGAVGSYPWMTTFLTGARETVAPRRGGRDGLLPPLLVALTAVTGLVDAFSYLVLGHVFVANQTGNVVFFAFALAGVGGFSATASVAAIGCFAAGALVAGRLGRSLATRRELLLGALAGALLVLHVHIVYPLVIALVILAAVAIIAVAWARNPRTTAT